MMKIVALLAVAGFLVLIVGCGEEDPTGPGPTVSAPTNLRITVAGTDSLSVLLSWDAPVVTGPADIDGYIVSFAGNVLDTVTTIFLQHTPTSLGTYSVKAYKGDDESSAIDTSTALHEEDNEGWIYWLSDPDTTHHSGYGWDSDDGNGSTYSVQAAYKGYIDMIVDTAAGYLILISPAERYDNTWHSTGMAYDDAWTYSNLTVAPQSQSYQVSKDVVVDGVFALHIQSGHYLKMEVIDYAEVPYRIKIKFGFQTVAGFRRLG